MLARRQGDVAALARDMMCEGSTSAPGSPAFTVTRSGTVAALVMRGAK